MLSLDRSRSHRHPGQPPCQLFFSPQKLTLSLLACLQSSFDDPCSALDHGFTTGFVPVSPGALPTRKEFVVDKPGPLWFYCQQQQPQPHCQAGMVFAVNPGTTVGKDDFETFLDKAKNAEGEGDDEKAGGKVSFFSSSRSLRRDD